MNKKSNPPNPGLFESLRSTGHNLAEALEEIIDNSISANAKNIWIDYDDSNLDDYIIWISDDGDGMNEEEIIKSMNLGAINNKTKRKSTDLGRYGLGLKTSSLSQARRFTVLSKKYNSTVTGWSWDLDMLSDTWEMVNPNQSQYDFFNQKISDDSGTLIVWEKIDNELTKTISSGTGRSMIWQKAQEHIRMTFLLFMTGKDKINIYLNDTILTPWDPFGRDISEKVFSEKSPIEVVGYVLPHQKKLSKEQHNELSGPKGWNAQQGFYLFRNKRLIISGEWLGQWQQEEHYKLARIMINIDNTKDSEWGLDFKKTKVIPSEGIKEQLKRIGNKVRNRAIEVYSRRATANLTNHNNPNINREGTWNFELIPDHEIGTARPKMRVNRRNAYIKEFLKSTNEHDINNLIRLLEEDIPFNEILLKRENLQYAFEPFENQEQELREILKSFIDFKLSQGISKDVIFKQIISCSPGTVNLSIIESLKDDYEE